jgi:hypothetical protein
MHDLTIAAACRIKASIHTQHHMMMMMKSNDTTNVPVDVEKKRIANNKDGLGQMVFLPET